MLLEAGASVNSTLSNGASPLWIACEQGDADAA
ncbi:hypothetical protein PF003_g17502 [Phytophthora fragariae]|nr:hypothetical protein PF003_g17502 [Phytophthora fragariae]